jgi:hypothetical protein
MVALAAEAMIAYWDVTHDSRVPPMLKLAADQIWQQSWDATNQCFKYYADDGSISLSQDLNLLIVPLYGWVYQQTGDVKYRDEGDQIFNAGVAGAWLDGGKQYSQNYRWSGKYVEWRSGVTPPPGALPQTLALDFADGAVLPTDAVLQVKYNPGPGFANLQYVWTLAPAGSVGASGRRSLGVGAIAAPVSERTNAPSLGLDRWAPLPGRYTVSVYATDGTSQSNTAAQTLTLVNADLSGVKVYPNPWRKDKHAGGNITFAGLPTNVTVKIFTASGHLVREAGGVSNEWRWDRKTDQGDEAASGVYLYLITDSQGNKKRGKVAIIR